MFINNCYVDNFKRSYLLTQQLFDRFPSAVRGMDRIDVGLPFRNSRSALRSLLFNCRSSSWPRHIESFPCSPAKQLL